MSDYTVTEVVTPTDGNAPELPNSLREPRTGGGRTSWRAQTVGSRASAFAMAAEFLHGRALRFRVNLEFDRLWKKHGGLDKGVLVAVTFHSRIVDVGHKLDDQLISVVAMGTGEDWRPILKEWLFETVDVDDELSCRLELRRRAEIYPAPVWGRQRRVFYYWLHPW